MLSFYLLAVPFAAAFVLKSREQRRRLEAAVTTTSVIIEERLPISSISYLPSHLEVQKQKKNKHRHYRAPEDGLLPPRWAHECCAWTPSAARTSISVLSLHAGRETMLGRTIRQHRGAGVTPWGEGVLGGIVLLRPGQKRYVLSSISLEKMHTASGIEVAVGSQGRNGQGKELRDKDRSLGEDKAKETQEGDQPGAGKGAGAVLRSWMWKDDEGK